MGIDRVDPCSFSEPEKIITKHISLDWTVDFTKKTIKGSATYRFCSLEKNLQKILLDINQIEISQVHLIIAKMEIPIEFSVMESGRDIGDILTLEIPKGILCGTLLIRITYETSPKPKSLYWLSPQETYDKVHPFVFSHCEPIGARSLLPCQDTPAVKFSYTATIHHPPELTALMSAPNRMQDNNGYSTFEQTVPIPSYLLAIVVGKLVLRQQRPWSNIWAEEERLIDLYAKEEYDNMRLMDCGMELCGLYVWKQYDVLVLPKVVSFTAVHNACLTIISEAIFALNEYDSAIVRAEQVAHCWAGNLVTTKNFQHLWLNEGFAKYIEKRIRDECIGEDRDYLEFYDLERLQQTIERSVDTPELTKLIVDLSNTHPNYAFSDVPSIKGSLFLQYLENTLGGLTVFKPFLRNYFKHFKYQSIESNDFKEYFCQYYRKTKYANKLELIDWDNWLNSEGMPPVISRLQQSSSNFDILEHLNIWNSKSVEALKNLSKLDLFRACDIIDLLTHLIASENINEFNEEKINLLEAMYILNQRGSIEIDIRIVFFRLCIRIRLKQRLDEILSFVNSNCCMRNILPNLSGPKCMAGS